MAPHTISKALRSRRSKNKDVDSIIRKHLYKEIVHKLKLGYDQSYLVSTRKRQRPHSPSQSGRWDGDQASDSTKMAKRPASVELEQTIPSRYKKRRMPEPQAPSNLSGLILKESGNLCNNEQKGLAVQIRMFLLSYLTTYSPFLFVGMSSKLRFYTLISIPTHNVHFHSTFAMQIPVCANQQGGRERI